MGLMRWLAKSATNVAALRAVLRLVAAVGRDAAGPRLYSMLAPIGAGTDRLVEVNRPKTTKTRILARVQQVEHVDEEEDADLAMDAERIARAAEDAVGEADALVLKDYTERGVDASCHCARDLAGAVALITDRRRSQIPEPLRVQGSDGFQT